MNMLAQKKRPRQGGAAACARKTDPAPLGGASQSSRNALITLHASARRSRDRAALAGDVDGSGMSSLSTLESFEFDTVKLDMGFIRKIGTQKVESIIRSTIELSHALGATVIAEGVENDMQLNFLRESDCDMIQGYYFFKPMSGVEFAKVLS